LQGPSNYGPGRLSVSMTASTTAGLVPENHPLTDSGSACLESKRGRHTRACTILHHRMDK